jgi:hypothetical protein
MYWWRFKSSGMLFHVVHKTVTAISKEHSAFICRVKQSNNRELFHCLTRKMRALQSLETSITTSEYVITSRRLKSWSKRHTIQNYKKKKKKANNYGGTLRLSWNNFGNSLKMGWNYNMGPHAYTVVVITLFWPMSPCIKSTRTRVWKHARLQDLTSVLARIQIFWDVKLCNR